MKLFSMMLLSVALSACMVDTPVVKDTGSDASQGIDVQAACESKCEKEVECQLSDTSVDYCAQECATYFAGMTPFGRGTICNKAAGRVADCYSGATCLDFLDNDPCNATAENERCAFSNGEVLCYSSSIVIDDVGGPPVCDVKFTNCTDAGEYELSCPGTADDPDCHCVWNGYLMGSYSPTAGQCPDYRDAKSICAFPIPAGRDEKPLAEVVTCTSPSSVSNGDPRSCSIMFDDCSDERSYAIHCDDRSGTDSCRCEIDGESVGFSPSRDAICSFADDIDAGAIALNYACDFHLYPVSQDNL